ncbi:MAG: lipoyl synthase [Spirochaetales bacterium]|nr:lipoyl synthase [Spirochaetales bacterium]
MNESARKPRPEWLRKEKKLSPEVMQTLREIANLGLHTICESARCPNLGECYQRGNATFLILGDRCTRNCGFCAVDHGPPTAPDPEEGIKIASYVSLARIRYAVITSVTRDDLPDGGAGHFRRVVEDIRARLPELGLELLFPDFQGRRESIEEVAGLPVQVLAHNVETVESLYGEVRRGADYRRSLEVLALAGRIRRPGMGLKSGIMVGLGESREELDALFADLAAVGVEILTIGQYLRPSQKNNPVVRYYNPEEFDELKVRAENKGIPYVLAGPYVRSSYRAEEAFRESREKRV